MIGREIAFVKKPRTSRRGECCYPFAEMRVGDWFFVPRRANIRIGFADEMQVRIARAANMWAKRNTDGAKFSVRIVSFTILKCERVA